MQVNFDFVKTLQIIACYFSKILYFLAAVLPAHIYWA